MAWVESRRMFTCARRCVTADTTSAGHHRRKLAQDFDPDRAAGRHARCPGTGGRLSGDLLGRAAAGSAAFAILGQTATPEVVAAMEEKLGLNCSRFAPRSAGRAATGGLGKTPSPGAR